MQSYQTYGLQARGRKEGKPGTSPVLILDTNYLILLLIFDTC